MRTHQGCLSRHKQVAAGVIMGACLARASAPQVERESQHGNGECQPAYPRHRVLIKHKGKQSAQEDLMLRNSALLTKHAEVSRL